ncbi:MAG: hypothetical protein QME64_12840 [bacterium]|nr:hypothetical protein [bacterium]
MHKIRNEFDEVIEELNLLNTQSIRKQLEDSLAAEKNGKTKKFTIAEFKKQIDAV